MTELDFIDKFVIGLSIIYIIVFAYFQLTKKDK